MAETWWFIDSAGAACGPGTRKALNETGNASCASATVTDGNSITFNRTETVRRLVKAGTWEVKPVVQVVTDTGDLQCIVTRRNSSCVIQETIMNKTNEVTEEGIQTFTQAGVGAVTFEAGDILVIELAWDEGGA